MITDEQIVEAARLEGQKEDFGELVRSKLSRGVNSAYGIGFIEGAEWARKRMNEDAATAEIYSISGGTHELLL